MPAQQYSLTHRFDGYGVAVRESRQMWGTTCLSISSVSRVHPTITARTVSDDCLSVATALHACTACNPGTAESVVLNLGTVLIKSN